MGAIVGEVDAGAKPSPTMRYGATCSTAIPTVSAAPGPSKRASAWRPSADGVYDATAKGPAAEIWAKTWVSWSVVT
jgi:hypothetical protein